MITKASFEKISVVGLGYIGLPTAAVIASRRVLVNGVDVDPSVVKTINEGKIHIIEPELDAIVHKVVQDKFLSATLAPESADAFIIAVPTPFKENHEPDLSYIQSASSSIAKVLEKGNLVILESTSPVGTTEKMSKWLAHARPDLTFPHTHGEKSDIRIAHCPERVLPGHVVRELVENDRVVGGMTDRCSKAAVSLYKIFVEAECVTTDIRTAEMCKLAENSFRDVNIAFANELSMICEKLDINVWELIRLANRHPRVEILQPGCGVGGHCIAVDPWFIISNTPELAKLITSARHVNNDKPRNVVNAIIEKAQAKNTSKILLLGITFKPNIDDVRESPALNIAIDLLSKDYEIHVLEPNLDSLPAELSSQGAIKVDDLQPAIDNEEFVTAILVAHKEFDEESETLKSIGVHDFCGVLKEK